VQGVNPWHTETVYAVIDLRPTQATAQQLGTCLRGLWSIQNRSHWVRDVTLGQDLSQARTGNGPLVMAILRNLAIGLPRLVLQSHLASIFLETADPPCAR